MTGASTMMHHKELHERVRELEAVNENLRRVTDVQVERLRDRVEKAEAHVAELDPEMWIFFREMTRKFRLHDKDRGDSWKQDGWPWVTRLREELEEATSVNALPDEWADVANYAFFAWWHCWWHSEDALNRRA